MLANRFHAGSDPGVNEEDRGTDPGVEVAPVDGDRPREVLGEADGVRPREVETLRGWGEVLRRDQERRSGWLREVWKSKAK